MMRRTLVFTLLLSTAVSIQSGFAQEAVFLVRHAEKEDAGSDPKLSPRGVARSWRLAEFLSANQLTAIYTSHLKRTRHTADPIAKVTGILPVVVQASDSVKLIELIRRDHPTGRVLVVGHSNTLPEILKGLGVTQPVQIDEADYEDFFVVIPRTDQAPIFMHYRF